MESQQLGEPLVNFSIDLYKQLVTKKRHKENIFFSPFSISAALSMSLAGARGNTARQLAKVLHVNSEEIHTHFSRFLCKLGAFAPDLKLNVANRMYSEQSFPVLDTYLSVLSYSYGTTMDIVDFKNNYEKVRGQINAWIEHVTESKIMDLLPDGSENDLTTQILVNAIYIKGLWNSEFGVKSTRPMYFHLDSKKNRSVDMMHQKNDYMLGTSDELRASASEIPYRGGKASMVVLLPDSYDGLSKLYKRLKAEKLLQLLRNLHCHSGIDLFLPKCKLGHCIKLKKTFIALGVKDLFTPSAHLTGISTSGKLLTSQVFHEACVEVNEEGTEAAAATAVNRVLCCASPQFKINRPFILFIRSLGPEAILFLGSVRDLGTE